MHKYSNTNHFYFYVFKVNSNNYNLFDCFTAIQIVAGRTTVAAFTTTAKSALIPGRFKSKLMCSLCVQFRNTHKIWWHKKLKKQTSRQTKPTTSSLTILFSLEFLYFEWLYGFNFQLLSLVHVGVGRCCRWFFFYFHCFVWVCLVFVRYIIEIQ